MVSPLFHAHSLLNTSFLLISGLTQVFAGRFEPGRMLELIEKHEATYLTGSPAMWHALSVHPDATVRNTDSVCVVSSGAAPIDSVTLAALRRAFPKALVVEGYGLTEATCVVTAAPLINGSEYRQSSVGLPIFDTEIQIRDQLDRKTVLGEHERGELWGAWTSGHRRLSRTPGNHRRTVRRRLVGHGRHRVPGLGRIPLHLRPGQGHAHLQGVQRLSA